MMRVRSRTTGRMRADAIVDRAPILREYVRVASSGRKHFPVRIGAPLADFAALADRYPVYRVDARG